VGNIIDGSHRRKPNESRDKDSPSTKCQRPSWRADEQVEVTATSSPKDGKLSLKVDISQVGQWHKDAERKWEYYYIIIIFPERA
jgi:hypothetical protein